ncbi:MAG: toxin-activating lysine-acyltransferase [Paracoccaceae bacterium]
MSQTEPGAAAQEKGNDAGALDPELVQKIAAVRSQVRESFGKIVMAMMMLPRYRHQTLGDLQHMLLEPLMRDRVAIAYPPEADKTPLADLAGVAIWASVSDEVDAKIREQVKAGVFPVRLGAADWASGEINWLLDVIAPNAKATASVISNFRQVVKGGDLRLHPVVAGMLDQETLHKMGMQRSSSEKDNAERGG